LLFPSICYEGLPNTIIESFSSGTPVIANDIDNINEIIEDNFNGEIMNFKIDKLSIKKIDEFDKKDLTEYQINSRNTYLSKYTHEENFKNLHQIYYNLINNEKKNNKC
jgi:glycosyltransferase involved in cell wall biosynthesis